MKIYEDCFNGSEAIAWVYDFLKANPNFRQNVNRTKAKLLCEKFLERRVIFDLVDEADSTNCSFEESRLYGFQKAQTRTRKLRQRDKNENLLCSSKKLVSSLKKHSSFVEPFHSFRQPLADAKELKNIGTSTNVKKMKNNSKHCVTKKIGGNFYSINENTDVNVAQTGDLSQKENYEFGIRVKENIGMIFGENLMAVMNDEEEVVCEEKELDNMCSRDLCKSTKELVNDIYVEDDKDDVMSQILPSQDRGCVKSDPNKLWLDVCLNR